MFSQAENKTGQANVSVGFRALQANQNGDYSVAVGHEALRNQNGVSGEYANVAIGYKAGNAVTTGVKNIFIGRSAGAATEDVDHAIGIGWAALNANATEDNNSCDYTFMNNPCDIVPSGLFVDNIIHNRVVFNWSAPSAAPSHYMIRYRVVGTSSWTVMTAGPVNSNEFTGTSRAR